MSALGRLHFRGSGRASVLLGIGILVLGASCGSSRDSTPHAGSSGRGPASAGSGTGGESGAGADSPGGALGFGGEGDGARGSSAAGRAGSGGTRSDANAGEAGATAESAVVHGLVLDIGTQRPLGGRRVVFARSLAAGHLQVVTTDANGAFTFDRPGTAYDAAVIEKDGSAVTVYTQLHTAELVLPHRWDGGVAATEFATVSGEVSGGATFPLEDARDIVAVNLFSNAAADRYLMGGGTAPYGPEYATTTSFDASGAAPATLVALGTFGRKGADQSEPAYAAFSAAKQLDLSAGDAVMLDLKLEAVALREIAGTATAPAGRTLTGMREHYRFPYPQAVLTFPAADVVRHNPLTADGAFTFELPELDQAGATLCLAAVSEEDGALWTERCGLAFDADPVSLELQAAPALLAPSDGDVIDETTPFRWSAFEAGIHCLELRPAGGPSPTTPAVTVFTADTEAVLPPLSSLDVTFPEGAAYTVDVIGLGPYASVDAALGPDGIGALIAVETRRSTSSAVEVTTAAP